MAKNRKGRAINGVLVLDKPEGMSSNHALQRAKRIFNAQKAGHTGSLDPLATGVLPLCFGDSTKFSQYVLDADKAYLSRFQLGVATTTGDAEGEVIGEVDPSALTMAQIETALDKLRGEIEQVPSMYSALKHNGQPLYKLARQGQKIERKRRKVVIHKLEVLDFQLGPQAWIDVEVACTKGTYVRSLAEDLGEMLGCGAHVSRLRRTVAEPYVLSQAITLEQLQELRDEERFAELDALLLPTDSPLQELPEVELDENTAHYLMMGQPVQTPGAPFDGEVRLRRSDGVFLGLGYIDDDGRVAPRRLCTNL